ncbi:hypothetical protein KCQ_04221 [Pectobacterium atrosepticum ICMP 1526]|nr:hypothetical protein KCQ_04221 [Pectobacterium atrosepticum ICMP 1526]
MSLRYYIFHPKANIHASIMQFSREFTGLNKNTYEEKTNDIVKNIEWNKRVDILFSVN